MSRLQYQLGVTLKYIVKMVWQIMFHDKDRQLLVNLDYQLVMKELALLITKTIFIRCYSIKCGLSSYSLQHNIRHYILALKIK